jgi:hypothetical protein
MDVGTLLSRALDILWKNKFLIALGALIALVGGEGTTRSVTAALLRYLPVDSEALAEGIPGLEAVAALLPRTDPDALPRLLGRLGIKGLLALFGASILLLIVVGVIVLVTRGGLIAGVDQVESGGETGFGKAWRVGWKRAWRLIIVASIPPIPITLAANLIVIGLTVFIEATGGVESIGETLSAPLAIPGLALPVLALTCPLALVSAGLALLWPLAERACVLEDRRALDSFRRAWQVFRANPGPALLLLLIQWGVHLALSSLLFLPGLLVALCFLFVPLVWVISGAGKALSSALWTLAWREWAAGTLPDVPVLE